MKMIFSRIFNAPFTVSALAKYLFGNGAGAAGGGATPAFEKPYKSAKLVNDVLVVVFG